MSLANRRVLYISYNGMLDPLGHSQVVPYLRELSKFGVRLTLLSFERPRAFAAERLSEWTRLRERLAASNIDWHWLRYHKTPSLPATAYDVAAGINRAGQLVRRKDIEMVHARGYIPATIALALKRLFGLRMIFDVRGLMGDEYVDAKHWRKDSVAYRITKSVERRALSAADGIVTLTERIWPIINEWDGLRNHKVTHEVVPCCADLELFRFSQSERTRRRQELGIDNRFVIIYSGSIDGWYLTEEMGDFFVALKKQKHNAFFLWLTPGSRDRLTALMRARGVADEDFKVITAMPSNVPSYLSAGDAGLAFIKPCFSKQASSPTKYAEYLGCGLPLIISAGIGDSDALITQEKVGALVRDFNEAEYAKAASVIEGFARYPDQTRRRTREVAERLFDVRHGGERYARLYERVLTKID